MSGELHSHGVQRATCEPGQRVQTIQTNILLLPTCPYSAYVPGRRVIIRKKAKQENLEERGKKI